MAETTEAKAASILTPNREPDRAEQAALDCVRKQAWVLWHADDYAAGVVRLLSRAGLLRDREREAEAEEAGRVMRRLEDEATTDLKRKYGAALAEIEQLRKKLRDAEGAPESPVTPPTPSTPGAEASEGTGEAQEG